MTITGGHDAAVLVNERFLNKVIGALFSMSQSSRSQSPQIEVSIESLPLNISMMEAMSFISQFPEIKISMDPLDIDLIAFIMEPPLIIIRSSKDAEVLFKLGIKPPTGRFGEKAVASGSARLTIGYDAGTSQFVVEIQDINIDQMDLENLLKVPYFLIAPVNRALSLAIKREIFHRLARISISTFIQPIPLPITMLTERLGASLPMSGPMSGMELSSDSSEKVNPALPLRIVGGGLLERGMVYGAINFLDHTGGTLRKVTAPDNGPDLQIAVSGPAIQSLVQYIWPYLPQKVNRSNRFDVPDYRSMMDAMGGVFDAVRTFGVSRRKVRVDRSWVEHGATIGYGLPELRLKDGGKMEIASCPLSVDVWASPKMEGLASPKTWTHSFTNFMRPGREITEPQPNPETITMFEFTHHMDLMLQGAILEIDITPDNMLTGKLSNVNLAIELPWKLPRQLLDQIANWLVNQIMNSFPTISMDIPDNILSGSLAPFSPLIRSLKIERIDSNESELIVNASLP